jgi:aminopeptidase N
LKFDFIIIHEAAHEWWGNSVTSNDIADMWIHESFGAYAEAIYVEHFWGYPEALKYINGKKQTVGNTETIMGVYNVHKRGAGDMYNKGQLVLNTLRNAIANDSLWFAILLGLQETFRYQSIDAVDIFNFVNEKTGQDFNYFFEQYLKHPKIPELEIFLTKSSSRVTARYKWNADVPDFRMPIKVTTAKDRFEFIYPTTSFQTIELGEMALEDFRFAEDLFYVNLNLKWQYLDPNLGGE